jgi:hypothetical protein
MERASLRYVGRSLYLAGSVRRRSPKRKREEGEREGKGFDVGEKWRDGNVKQALSTWDS